VVALVERQAELLEDALHVLLDRARRDDELLAATLASLPPGRHCFEFRHPSWFVPEVYALLRAHGAALVIGHDGRRPLQTLELTADFTFVRFHEGTRGRNGNYSHAEIEEWAGRLERWSREADVFAYYNNDWEGYAIENASYLRSALRTAATRASLPNGLRTNDVAGSASASSPSTSSV
jgi:uncharacterized protein YecE (DUF72 family)